MLLQGQHPWLYTYSLEHGAFLQAWDPSLVLVTPDSLHLSYGVDAIDDQCRPLGVQYYPVADFSLRFFAPDTLSLDGVPYGMHYDAGRGQMELWSEGVGGYMLGI